MAPPLNFKNCGVLFHSNTALSDNVFQVRKETKVHIRDLYKVHHLLDLNISVLLAYDLGSRVVYCNPPFSSFTEFELESVAHVYYAWLMLKTL